MPLELFCRYPLCRTQFTSVAGLTPRVCPGCKRPARWSRYPHVEEKPKATITYMDRRLLKSLRIACDFGAE